MVNSKQEILKLIELYKTHECLWNISSKYFRRTDIKNNAYRKISTELGIDEEVVKKKIKSLRTSYTAEKRKLENSKKSGVGLEDIKEPNLFYYEEMAFLDPCIIYRKGQTNLNCSGSTNDSQESHIDIPDESQYELDQGVSFDSGAENKGPPAKKPKEIENSISNFDGALNKFISAVNSDTEDEFHLFGLQVASNLRKIPLGHALQLMASFQQQMTDARVQILHSPHETKLRTSNVSSISPMSSSSSPAAEIYPTISTPVIYPLPSSLRTVHRLNEPINIVKAKSVKLIRPPSISPSSSSSTSMDIHWHEKFQQPPYIVTQNQMWPLNRRALLI